MLADLKLFLADSIPLMTRRIIVFLALCLVLGSCTQRMVCPAYQSAFIYDKDELRKKFSYFLDDSTPKVLTASKNKYLVAEPTTYRQKIRSMQTVRLKEVPVHVPDSLSGKIDSVSMADLDKAARSVIDSTVIVDVPQSDSIAQPLDSIYVITKDKELRLLKYNAPDSLDYDPTTQRYVRQKASYSVADVRYNNEEDNYMWYLRDALVLPDVRIAKLAQAEGGAKGEKEKSGKKKQGFFGFFKNLFKKKKKEEIDSASLNLPPKEEFDYIDEADTVAQTETQIRGQQAQVEKQPKEKKGLFGKKKSSAEKPPKKKKKEKPVKEAKEEPKVEDKEKKKKDEDDGF
jgi:hypothetical protein